MEDDAVTRWMVRNALKNECEFITAPSANKAFAMFSSFTPDVVFLDINLPDNSGYAVLEWILKNDPGACVVMFSSNGQLDNIVQAMEKGASGFISKPFLREHLCIISKVIRRAPFNRPIRRFAMECIANLSENAKLMEAAIVNAKDGVIITTADLNNPTILYVNEAVTRISGYEAHELIGQTPRILQGRDTDRKVLRELKDCLSKGRPFKGELKNYTKMEFPTGLISALRQSGTMRGRHSFYCYRAGYYPA